MQVINKALVIIPKKIVISSKEKGGNIVTSWSIIVYIIDTNISENINLFFLYFFKWFIKFFKFFKIFLIDVVSKSINLQKTFAIVTDNIVIYSLWLKWIIFIKKANESKIKLIYI